MKLVPLTQRQAKAYITEHHRHHKPPRGDVFRVGIEVDGVLRGVVTAGRPVSRILDDGYTLEVTRVATDGVYNGCSKLYSSMRRAATALGYRKLITYTLPDEGGSSLRAAGWVLDGPAGGGSWSCPSRPRVDQHPTDVKWRWTVTL